MPRGFTKQEKILIRKRLLETGAKAFGLYGIRKTSVEELARGAGISKGAFYRFFQSKEDLYFTLMREFEEKQHQQILSLLKTEEEVNEQAKLKKILLDMMHLIDDNPFIRSLLEGKEWDYLRQRFTEEHLEEALAADLDLASALTTLWEQRGKLKIKDPALVTGVLRGVFFLVFHREDIGTDVFPEVIDLILDAVIERLIDP